MKAVALDGFTGAWFQSGTSFVLFCNSLTNMASSFYLHHHYSHPRQRLSPELNDLPVVHSTVILELFQAVLHSSFRNHLPHVSMGSQSPSRSLPLSFSTPCLYLPTCTWLASHFLWMMTIKMRTLPSKVFYLAVYPQVKCLACSRCSVDKHVKWMNNGGIEIDVPVKTGDINQKQS